MRTLLETVIAEQSIGVHNRVRNQHQNEAFHAPGLKSERTKPQLSYINIPGDCPMLGLTIGDMIVLAASQYKDTEAFVAPFQGIRKTFKELQYDVDSFSRGLCAMGLKRGDRIAVWSPNSYECYLTQLSGWKVGLIVVCLNTALQGRELLYALNKVGVRCIVISKVFRSQDFYTILTSSIPEIKTCPVGKLKSASAPELEYVISVEPDLLGCIDFYDVLDIGANNIPLPPGEGDAVQFDDVCSLFFTSGTTGSPKAVMLSHHNFINNGYFVGKRLRLQCSDRICLPVPLFHVYGCQVGIFASIVHGATTVIPSYGYDPNSIPGVSSTERCTIITGTPTMFADMMKSLESTAALDLNCLRSVITGGAICPEDLVKSIRSRLPLTNVVCNYGMTEIGCTFMSLPTDPDSLVCSTTGFPCENTEVKLVDRKGRIVPIGKEGELCVRSYAVTLGYWGEHEKTSEVVEQSKWFHTGDLFVLSESGHGRVVGRIKEMVNRGGENVYPKEVEDFLKTHPKIKEAQVFGMPDDRLGEEPAVWIQLKKDQVMTPEDVKAFCKGQMAHFKIPKYILFRDDFPTTPLGKVQKFRMREETLKILSKVQ